jgi:hypothetical protein
LVEDAMAGYLAELAEARGTLHRRYEDSKSARVENIDGEEAFPASPQQRRGPMPQPSCAIENKPRPRNCSLLTYHPAMAISFEEALLSVWRQSLVEDKKTVTVGDASFPVRSTAKKGLKQIDFQFEGRDLRGLEQNPDTNSRWAAMARNGTKVMQFLEAGGYVAVVSDGKVRLYPSKT